MHLADGEPLELELEHVVETGELVRWTGELAAFLRDELRAEPHPGWPAGSRWVTLPVTFEIVSTLAESARALGTTPAELARQVVEKRLEDRRRMRRGGLPL